MLRGTAVAWRREIAGLLAEYAAVGDLDFTEVIAENTDPERIDERLTDLARVVPVVPHGVTLGLAGADEPAPDRLMRLARLALAFGSPVVSEHVAFVRAADSPDPLHPEVLEAGHLLPPPRTREALEVVVENVRIAQSQLPVPLAVENIAALFTWPEDTLTEAEFLTELVERTGCRLVLDVANLFASATARGSDPARDLGSFPLEAVAYVHVAGGEFTDGLYVDTHGHDLVEPVVDLLQRLGTLYAGAERPGGMPGGMPGVMLERDTDVTVPGVRREYDRLRAALGRPSLGEAR
ncbi:MAG TPA: DUF692 family protein [Nocardioides sp.]|jgi:hypothetical protein